jgi:hypothetical protein
MTDMTLLEEVATFIVGVITALGSVKAATLWVNKVLDKMTPVLEELDKIKAEFPQALTGINSAEKLIEDARTATEDGQVSILEGLGLLHDIEDVLEQAKPIYAALKAWKEGNITPVVAMATTAPVSTTATTTGIVTGTTEAPKV